MTQNMAISLAIIGPVSLLIVLILSFNTFNLEYRSTEETRVVNVPIPDDCEVQIEEVPELDYIYESEILHFDIPIRGVVSSKFLKFEVEQSKYTESLNMALNLVKNCMPNARVSHDRIEDLLNDIRIYSRSSRVIKPMFAIIGENESTLLFNLPR